MNKVLDWADSIAGVLIPEDFLMVQKAMQRHDVAEALREAKERGRKEAIERVLNHIPQPSDLVGWFCRCSCAKEGEIPYDCETEREWFEHILAATVAKYKKGEK